MTEYHVGCGFAGIYAGTVRTHKNGERMWTNKSNVTDEAIGAVAQYLVQDESEYTFTMRGKRYVLKVEEIADEKIMDEAREIWGEGGE